MLALLVCSLVACGGAEAPAVALRSEQVAAGLPATASPPSIASPASALEGRVLTLVTENPSAPTAPGADDKQADPVMARVNGRLGADGHVTVLGLPAAPPVARAWPDASPAGRRFVVDSQRGDDRHDGRSVEQAWRSLARLAAAPLEAGDQVILACGSRWAETLRLASSGTAQRPLIVRAPASGCSEPPTIDGSIELPATAWTRVQGSVFRAPLTQPPLQVFSDAGPWLPAHHPNRTPAGPTWLALAADGNVTMANGREVSTRLPTGADLQWPAGAAPGPGLRVRVRTAAFVVDDLPVAGSDGRTLTLAAPTTYPVKAAWGYLLTGQAWMVDSAGEWFHDAGAGQLIAHDKATGGAPALPSSASVLATGIDLSSRNHVVVDGLRVRKVGTGALLRGSRSVVLRNSLLTDLADRGIDAAASQDVVIESNRIERSGSDAVFAGGMAAPAASGLIVRDNHIRHSGVLMADDTVLSLPRRSYAAVLAGQAATVRGNVIIDSAYIGIRVFERSVVERNVVIGSCSALDDCAGIYTLGADNGSRISGNLVWRVRGYADGKPATARYPQAQGIYLDDDASGVHVDGNTVIDADHGLQLHDASANQVLANRLYGNRVAQLWLQETHRGADGGGGLRGNLFEDNLLAPVHAQSISLLAETLQDSASAFGRFDRNHYFEAAPGRIGSVRTTLVDRDVTALAWFGTPGLASATAADPHGSHSTGTGHAAYSVGGPNRMPNGDLAAGHSGWSHWNAQAPAGQLQLISCAGGSCLRYTAGAPPGQLSSPNFSIEQGRWYRLSVDLAADADGQPVQLVLRRGGGGRNGYERLSDRSLATMAGLRLQRHAVVFQATGSVRAGDPVTGDLGARVDIESLAAGRSITVARLELVPITPYLDARRSLAIVNAGPSPVDAGCPLPASQAATCTRLLELGLPGRVSWPLRLAPHSTRVLHAYEAALPDADGDGIADWQDTCPGTPARQVVNAAGCALGAR